MRYSRILQLFLFCFFSGALLAQPTTRTDSAPTSGTKPGNGKPTVLVIPWYPKMFNASSDVTRSISATTGQNYNQIQESLRKGMCDQFRKTFSPAYNVVTLLDDTAKMKVDLMYTYNVTTTEYVSVNAPLNPDPPAPKKDIKGAAAQTTTGIKNGQIQVEEKEGDKFMNTVLISPNLMEHLRKIYNCDYVIFLNQMDIQNDLGSDPLNTAGATEFNRSAALHWTIFNALTGKRVAMGKSKGSFANSVNTPKKIIEGAFTSVSKAVYTRFTTAITPKK